MNLKHLRIYRTHTHCSLLGEEIILQLIVSLVLCIDTLFSVHERPMPEASGKTNDVCVSHDT